MKTNSRDSVQIPSVAVGTSLATSDAIDFSTFDRGEVYVPVGAATIALTWNSSIVIGGTYLPAYTEANVAIVTTVAAGRSYPIPDALRGARFLKIVGDAACVVGVVMKD